MSLAAAAVRPVLGSAADGAVLIPCHVQPRASREAVAGLHDGALKVALTAPPVDGKANDALIRFLSRTLDLPRGSLRLVSGPASRRKVIAASGIDLETTALRLAAATV